MTSFPREITKRVSIFFRKEKGTVLSLSRSPSVVFSPMPGTGYIIRGQVVQCGTGPEASLQPLNSEIFAFWFGCDNDSACGVRHLREVLLCDKDAIKNKVKCSGHHAASQKGLL